MDFVDPTLNIADSEKLHFLEKVETAILTRAGRVNVKARSGNEVKADFLTASKSKACSGLVKHLG